MGAKDMNDELASKIRELSLQLKLIKIRADIHESLLVSTRIALHLCEVQSPPDPGKALQDARDQILSELEEIGAACEKGFFNSAILEDAEKALYADEIQALVDHMKTHLSII